MTVLSSKTYHVGHGTITTYKVRRTDRPTHKVGCRLNHGIRSHKIGRAEAALILNTFRTMRHNRISS